MGPGGESVRPGSTPCLRRTWGNPDKNPHQCRHLFKNSTISQSSSGPNSLLCCRLIQGTNFSIWFMSPRWRAPSRLRLVSIGMQNIYFRCLSARHTALGACPFACGWGRGVWLAVFRYCKYLSHSHSCCRDPVSAPSVAMVKAPVHQEKLLAEILWIHARALEVFFFFFGCLFAVELYWRHCCFPSSGSSSAFNCPFFPSFSVQSHHLFFAFVHFFFLHSHMWWF